MAKRGEVAKATAADIIQKAFGENFVGINDKKIYVNVNDGGEMIQLAISMTMPKVPYGNVPQPHDWSGEASPVDASQQAAAAVEISEEDKETVAKLLADLGVF